MDETLSRIGTTGSSVYGYISKLIACVYPVHFRKFQYIVVRECEWRDHINGFPSNIYCNRRAGVCKRENFGIIKSYASEPLCPLEALRGGRSEVCGFYLTSAVI